MYIKIVMTDYDPADEGWLRAQYAVRRDGAFLLHTDKSADAIREELLRTVGNAEITKISREGCWSQAGFPADSPLVLDTNW
jgi:hypothetical protein